jgi:beta-glucosidase
MENEADLPAFPRGFIFGAATASFQIEGGWNSDGKGPSIWDDFSHRSGKIRTGETGDVTCGHYSLWQRDIEIMKELGLQAYRGSISWPRVQPEGRGKTNQKGVDFYSRLTDGLLQAGIQPWYTLFHWDLPSALQREGGFRKRETALRFSDYVEIIVRALGDRVRRWITVNEPWEFSCLGHMLGDHAPGLRNPRAFFAVMHNVLLAHGLSLERIRSLCPDGKAGITLSFTPVFPNTGSGRDAMAARIANEFMNYITLSPILKGKYPELLRRRARVLFPRIHTGDMGIISRPVDFIGVNYYSRERASYRWYVPFLHAWISGKGSIAAGSAPEGVQRTAMGWEVWPEGFDHVLGILRSEYGNPPVVITENGAAFDDAVTDGRVHDAARIGFLRGNLAALKRSMDAGSDVRGYFVWSLLDNFEWAEGTRPRFGIVHVDFTTLARTIKDSGYWYRDLIRRTRPAPSS